MNLRLIASIVTALSLLCTPAFGFDSPLSDEAVREAYFLGQRHDASFLVDYVKALPLPKTGPHIAVITLLTPFAQLAQHSSSYIGIYSAQQAVQDHRGQKEIVKISVEIYFTASYSATIPAPGNTPSKYSSASIPRPSEFWRDFNVEVLTGNELILASDLTGHLVYRGCGHHGQCGPVGAVLELAFPPSAFSADTITIRVTPPEGDRVSVDFHPSRLR